MEDSQFWMNGLTAGLAVATVWLAVETRRMASAAKAQVELQGQPHLAIRGVDVATAQTSNIAQGTSGPALRLAIDLFNPGHVLVRYQVLELESSLGNVSLNTSTFHTRGGVVHPGAGTLFLLPFVQVGAAGGVMSVASDVKVKIAYWAVPSQKRTVAARMRFDLLSISPAAGQWVFLDGPDYS